MSVKDKFSEQEWESIVQSPMLAGIAITAADPGGLWSALKESAGVARSLLEAKSSADADSLATHISATFQQPEGRRAAQERLTETFRGKKPAEMTALAVDRLGESRALVERKAPEHAAAYKQFVRMTAEKVAEAGKEGGFLGFGGERVSDAEKKTLADIDRALA
ncbi:MAG: hypothetical protein P8008_00905 [Gammaproteobacteria bacterium]